MDIILLVDSYLLFIAIQEWVQDTEDNVLWATSIATVLALQKSFAYFTAIFIDPELVFWQFLM